MRKIVVLAALAVAALVVAPLVGAAVKNPKQGHYQQLTKDKKQFVVDFDVQGGKVKQFAHYDKCAPLPLIDYPAAIRIKSGTFKWSGKVKDPLGGKYSTNLTGTFVKKTVAIGTFTIKKLSGKANGSSKPGCHTTTKFRAVYTAQQQG